MTLVFLTEPESGTYFLNLQFEQEFKRVPISIQQIRRLAVDAVAIALKRNDTREVAA